MGIIMKLNNPRPAKAGLPPEGVLNSEAIVTQ